MQYLHRPYWALEVVKALALITLGLILAAIPLLIARPAWLGLR